MEIVRCINPLQKGLFFKGVIYEVFKVKYIDSGNVVKEYFSVIDGKGEEVRIKSKTKFYKHFESISLQDENWGDVKIFY